MRQTLLKTQTEIEKAFLVGVDRKASAGNWSIESSLEKLSYLARTAGAKVVGRLDQKLERPSPTYYLGKGKLEELIKLREHLPYSVVIFNDELSPRQQRNLEETLEVKVIDRTALILEIFSRRIHRLQSQIEAVRRHRALYRQKRKRSHIPVVALVGYTNAGKSTLLNALSNADVLEEDTLFSTLAPVTRRF